MKQLFVITKRSPRPVNSLTSPAAAAVRGVAMQESATAGVAELADGSKPFAGFLTRNTQVGGPVLGDVIYPGRLELPTETSGPSSMEFGEEVEAEGATFLDASLTSGAALKTPLTFAAGKFIAATTGKLVEFELVEQQTPVNAGNVRIRARAVYGYVHA
jgi:hypothetical protein